MCSVCGTPGSPSHPQEHGIYTPISSRWLGYAVELCQKCMEIDPYILYYIIAGLLYETCPRLRNRLIAVDSPTVPTHPLPVLSAAAFYRKRKEILYKFDKFTSMYLYEPWIKKYVDNSFDWYASDGYWSGKYFRRYPIFDDMEPFNLFVAFPVLVNGCQYEFLEYFESEKTQIVFLLRVKGWNIAPRVDICLRDNYKLLHSVLMLPLEFCIYKRMTQQKQQ